MIRSYRYNSMQLNTLEAFADIHGALRGDVRDVYFVRALGTVSGYAGRIEAIDRRLDAQAVSGSARYIRGKGLPSIASATSELTRQAELYDQWKNNPQTSLFPTASGGKSFEECVRSALLHVTELFRSSGVHRSDSMVRNYAAKLLFWTSEMLGKQISGSWSEQANIKIILEDIKKEQEYLFCYFLTRLGADVMLLLPTGDLEISPQLKSLSHAFTIGSFGQAQLRPYTPAPDTSRQAGHRPQAPAPDASRQAGHKPQAPDTGRQTPAASQPSHAPVIRIPRREDRHANERISSPAANSEKSYEELAQLASSIVMIAVHDPDGKVNGTGSGIMIGEKGFIITNFHVISGGAFFSVRIEDDDTIYTTDEVIKYNTSFDLAVIRIAHTLRPLPIYDGRARLVRGQKVVAIGSPLGLFNSVSDGIISGFRTIDNIDMIQFTAPTSPGSSGGALLNLCGEVIGISTAGLENGQNINLAVPYDTIRFMANGFF